MQSPVPGAGAQTSGSAPVSPWIDHLGQISYIRGHVSVFAAGAVILLVLDLLSGDGGVWADTLIALWAVLLVAHIILAAIARLLRELVSEEPAAPRPVTEPPGRVPDTWALAPRPGNAEGPAAPQPAAPTPNVPPASTPPPAPQRPAASERVPWAEATRAAWLARRTKRPEPEAAGTPDTGTNGVARNDDSPNDFTPLKLD